MHATAVVQCLARLPSAQVVICSYLHQGDNSFLFYLGSQILKRHKSDVFTALNIW